VCAAVTTACGQLGQACCSTGAPCVAAGAVCGTSGVCVAPTTGGRRPYDPCNAGDACAGGTTCAAANLSVSGGAPGGFCTLACNGASACPVDAFGQVAACVLVGGSGECYQRCPAGGGCPLGTTCAQPSGTPEAVCVPDGAGTVACGHLGQVCCAGGACVDGSSCGADGTCIGAPGPYEGCAPIGATCTGGTTCEQPMVANPGPTGWCTNACFGSGSDCAGLPGFITDCYILLNSTSGQCYVGCPSGAGCPTGTTCVMTDTETTTGVRLCMPPPG
jgi:hypothetical protein